MIPYDSNFNTNGNPFPTTQAINVSSPGAGDGTEFIALMVNDIWGSKQAIMYHAFLTPSGSSETYSSSQILQALKNGLSPVGTVLMTHAQSDPTSLGFRLLLMNGQGIFRANYPELDTICYVGDPNNGVADAYYHADDAAGAIRNTTGNYLILPDMRGVFVRGYDPTALVDPDGAGRIFPDFQDHAMDGHDHSCYFQTGGSPGAQEPGALYSKDGGGAGSYNLVATKAGSTDLTTAGSLAGTNQSTETRPANYQVKFWLRY